MKPDSFFKGTPTYLLDEKLAEAFHIARLLEKPLLLEGEPGTGKTKLAQEFAIQEGLVLTTLPQLLLELLLAERKPSECCVCQSSAFSKYHSLNL